MRERKTWIHHRLYGWRRGRRITGLLRELAHIEHGPESETVLTELDRYVNMDYSIDLTEMALKRAERLERAGTWGV